jgi:hypothetical protein
MGSGEVQGRHTGLVAPPRRRPKPLLSTSTPPHPLSRLTNQHLYILQTAPLEPADLPRVPEATQCGAARAAEAPCPSSPPPLRPSPLPSARQRPSGPWPSAGWACCWRWRWVRERSAVLCESPPRPSAARSATCGLAHACLRVPGGLRMQPRWSLLRAPCSPFVTRRRPQHLPISSPSELEPIRTAAVQQPACFVPPALRNPHITQCSPLCPSQTR